jgi:hypothetical protein
MAFIHSIRYYPPQPALQPFVSSYMIAFQQLDPSDPLLIRPTPVFPEQSLYFHPHHPNHPMRFSADGEKFNNAPQSNIIGPYTRSTILHTGRQELIIRVILRAGALHRLMQMPLHELHNIAFDATNGFGNEIRAINDQLAQQTGHDKMLSIIENFLLQKASIAKERLPIDRAFEQIQAAPNRYSIEQLADMACVSLRQFER